MKPFDYNKYIKNNLLLKETEDEKGYMGTQYGSSEDMATFAIKKGMTGIAETSPSQNTEKIEKFMKDNEVFINKIKVLVGSNPKMLADLIDTLNQKITTDKKLRQTSDAQQAGKFLKKAAGKKPTETNQPKDIKEMETEPTVEAAIDEDAQTKIFRGNEIRRSYRPKGSTNEINVGDQFTESIMGMTRTSPWGEKAGSTYEVIEDLGNDTYVCKVIKHNDY